MVGKKVCTPCVDYRFFFPRLIMIGKQCVSLVMQILVQTGWRVPACVLKFVHEVSQWSPKILQPGRQMILAHKILTHTGGIGSVSTAGMLLNNAKAYSDSIKKCLQKL